MHLTVQKLVGVGAHIASFGAILRKERVFLSHRPHDNGGEQINIKTFSVCDLSPSLDLGAGRRFMDVFRHPIRMGTPSNQREMDLPSLFYYVVEQCIQRASHGCRKIIY